jgi:hypothetical protein
MLKLILYILIELIPVLSHAELSYLDLKGIDALVDHPGVSPVHGYIALKSHLENRRFLGNYGPKNDQHGCLEHAPRIHSLFIEKQDCPQDYNSEWLQRLFPSQDGANFVANQVESDPVSHLTPDVIGEVLARVAQVKDDEWNSDLKMSHLEMDLTHILYRGTNPKSYEGWLKDLKKEKGKVETERNRLQKLVNKPTCTPEDQLELDLRKSHLRQIEAILERAASAESSLLPRKESSAAALVSSEGAADKKAVGKKDDFMQLAALLVRALKESRVSSSSAALGDYPRYLPEQALLALMIKKSNIKADLLDYFQGFGRGLSSGATAEASHAVMVGGGAERGSGETASSVTGSGRFSPDPVFARIVSFLHTPEGYPAFLADRWKTGEGGDYRPDKITADPAQAAQEMATHPERLVFYSMQEKMSKPIPPILSYSTAQDKTAHVSYPDCGETSLRNFFNIVLYHPETQKFNAESLTQLKAKNPNLNFSPGIQGFYQTHSDPANAASKDVHDDWSEVVSRHGGVSYLKGPGAIPQCEINAGVDNMMKVVDGLIFSGNPQLAATADRASRLDLLCRSLSQEGKLITWSVAGVGAGAASKAQLNSNNVDVMIHFKINGEPTFAWEFKKGHFAVQDLTGSKASWKNRLGEALARSPTPASRAALPLFAGANTFESLEKRISEAAGRYDLQLRENLIYALPLANNEGKLEGFRRVVSSPGMQARQLKPLADRLRRKLPEATDNHTKQQIYAALADANNPYDGDTIHLLEKPAAVFTRVSHHDLVRKIGSESARKMGRSWSRKVFGYPVIIGEPLLDEQGAELKLGYDQALEACIRLNPPDKQAIVRAALKRRSAALSAFKNAYPHPADFHEKLAQIHRENRIPGVFLMDGDEWRVIGLDFGHRENQYLPQILPKLLSGNFWASDAGGESHELFYGGSGYTNPWFGGDGTLVRCSTSAW